MSTSSAYTWGDIALTQTVLIDDVPHITRQGIGEWLEYADPQNAITKILERNPHIDHYSTPVNLSGVDGKNREHNVYHPIGFLLIVMESGQPTAKEKKVEVAEFVWHFSNPGTERLAPKEKRAIRVRISAIAARMAKTKDAFELPLLWDEMRQLCDKIGMPYPDISYLGHDYRQTRIPGMDVGLIPSAQPAA